MRRTIVFSAWIIATLSPLLNYCRQMAVLADEGSSWTFAVSGDSRNCGDVVMPLIASSVLENKASFYWHLGDFRAIYKVDEDFVNQKIYMPKKGPGDLSISKYQLLAWPDFIEHQIQPFGSLPVFLGIGNHETIAPKTREEYLVQFSAWLNSGPVQRQRADNPDYKWDWKTTTYYRWIQGGVDFINLDNATGDQFDQQQINWLETVLTWDAQNSAVKTIVVGMHEALPDSFSDSHSMSETATGLRSGRHVYEDLLRVRDGTFAARPNGLKTPKIVYVLASHSHYYMKDIYNTPPWSQYGKTPGSVSANGVLDGWIVGTAGAERHSPPTDPAGQSRTIPYTYGYVLGTVALNGTISFKFNDVQRTSVSKDLEDSFVTGFVDLCFDKNRQPPPQP
jgi:hypothetical protein